MPLLAGQVLGLGGSISGSGLLPNRCSSLLTLSNMEGAMKKLAYLLAAALLFASDVAWARGRGGGGSPSVNKGRLDAKGYTTQARHYSPPPPPASPDGTHDDQQQQKGED